MQSILFLELKHPGFCQTKQLKILTVYFLSFQSFAFRKKKFIFGGPSIFGKFRDYFRPRYDFFMSLYDHFISLVPTIKYLFGLNAAACHFSRLLKTGLKTPIFQHRELSSRRFLLNNTIKQRFRYQPLNIINRLCDK